METDIHVEECFKANTPCLDGDATVRWEQCDSMEDIGRRLLKSIGVPEEAATDDMIAGRPLGWMARGELGARWRK